MSSHIVKQIIFIVALITCLNFAESKNNLKKKTEQILSIANDAKVKDQLLKLNEDPELIALVINPNDKSTQFFGINDTFENLFKAFPDNDARIAAIKVNSVKEDGEETNKMALLHWSPDSVSTIKRMKNAIYFGKVYDFILFNAKISASKREELTLEHITDEVNK